MTRPKNTLFVELPLLLWLVLVWGALWGDFRIGNLLFGALLAVLVTWILYLPPVHLSGRLNAWHLLVFLVTFVWQVAKGSFNVMAIAVLVGPRARSAIISVPLRTRSDLLLTATGHTMSLIPGSLVVEVDRSSSTLYFHALNIRTDEEAEEFRRATLDIEASWIRIMGAREELAALKDESHRQGRPGAKSAAISMPATGQQRAVQDSARNRSAPEPEEERP